MATDLREIDNVAPIEHAQIHDLMRRFIEILHERNRDFVQIEPLKLHALAQLEQPNPERVLVVGALEPTAFDEAVCDAVHGRLWQLRARR